jgi:hypothetical protein
MESKKVIEGINIIYNSIPEDNTGEYYFHPGHDQIWVGKFEWITNDVDKARLEELGWFEDEDSWSCFT